MAVPLLWGDIVPESLTNSRIAALTTPSHPGMGSFGTSELVKSRKPQWALGAGRLPYPGPLPSPGRCCDGLPRPVQSAGPWHVPKGFPSSLCKLHNWTLRAAGSRAMEWTGHLKGCHCLGSEKFKPTTWAEGVGLCAQCYCHVIAAVFLVGDFS